MATTYRIVGENIVATTTEDPSVETLNRTRVGRRITQIDSAVTETQSEITRLNNRITALQDEKATLQSLLSQLPSTATMKRL